MATNQQTIDVGPWGGSTGNDWREPVGAIQEIQISYDEHAVNSLSINGKSNLTGSTQHIKIASPREYLKWIEGTVVDAGDIKVIGSLTFYTNERPHGPYGNIGGEKFTVPTANAEIVGFFGRIADKVNAVGICIKYRSD